MQGHLATPTPADAVIQPAGITALEDHEFDERSIISQVGSAEHAEPSAAAKKRPADAPPRRARKRRRAALSPASALCRKIDEALRKFAPNIGRPYCVVTCASDVMTILEYAHVVSGETSSKVLEKLEWAWNMGYGTLDLHTPKNIHPLSVDVHCYYNRTTDSKHDGWFWLPADQNTVLKMYQCYVGRSYSRPVPAEYPNVRRNPREFQFYDKKKSFEYRVVPFRAMEASWTIRRPAIPTAAFDSTNRVIQYYYPFKNLPSVSLHVPPHFVICDTARKLRGVYGGDYRNIRESVDLKSEFPGLEPAEEITLLAVAGIYDAWMNAVPSDEWRSGALPDSDAARGHSSNSGGVSPSDLGGDGGAGDIDPGVSGQPQQGVDGGRESSLAPGDSASCRDVADESCEEGAADEEEEWEDPEYGAWLQQWVEDVWEATHGAMTSSPGSQGSLVGAPTDGKAAGSIDSGKPMAGSV
ncbi:hypothetical protein GLOTRDRAFT_128888 [Gloeophyllum trabeum ATCC 11539]|uniref:Uncharacterized protein n=1 Tax=Gloeophyllum trabeum (strain ATCC 11539 / FP-39264 / Madison 617) TaxID=670483 RepID=S7RRR2_GLOTA|nr:uncharacterized protein GLOTRDRAFT_128888 [Gloeophyllum trabeum ATCC 11539]EPQ55674.1 hypothetical protein GLOTRDRAFT_128888 [Gloeophyllum trabeum ATCC 11539]